MEGAVVLVVLIVLAVLFLPIILLVTFKNHLSDKIDQLASKIEELKRIQKSGPAAPVQSPKEETKPVPLPAPSSPVPPPPPPEKPREEYITPVYEEKIPPPVKIPVPEKPPVPPPKPMHVIPEKTFWEKNPDLEKFIGENLINKIGIAILVLGIGFFVKYAIDKDWINEIGRTAIGILAGGVLIGLAHRLRKSFHAFSSVLVGGGLAVLYFTISIAFHEYALFSQAATFAIMVVITAFAVLLSIFYNRIELAVLSIAGGFATPFMVSTGEGNYIVLFTYIMILNSGMLVLAYYKKWNLLNILCYILTVLLYGGWLVSKVVDEENAPYTGAMVFGSLFYVTFFLMTVIYNLKTGRKFAAGEILILLSNTFLYYSAGMLVLNHIENGAFKGLYTAGLGVYNLAFTYLIYKNSRADRNLVYMLIALVLTFLSLTAPVQLEGNYITLFWSAEAVLLYFLWQKSGIRVIRWASLAVMQLMVFSLVMDWGQIYHTIPDHENSAIQSMNILLNKGFITGAVSILSVLGIFLLLKKEKEEFILENILRTDHYKTILGTAAILLLYIVPLLELNYQLDQYIELLETRRIILGSYNFIFAAGLMIHSSKTKIEMYALAAFILCACTIASYPLHYNLQVIGARNAYLAGSSTMGGFLYHYIDLALLALLFYLAVRNRPSVVDIDAALQWAFTFVGVFVMSAELDHLVLINSFYPGFALDHFLKHSQTIGYPILWGICSFILMFFGMRKKNRNLRIISLSLFFVTLAKLFIYDIRDISEGGKIAAFISLGILLLIVSFMYQKLKKIVLEDDSKINAK